MFSLLTLPIILESIKFHKVSSNENLNSLLSQLFHLIYGFVHKFQDQFAIIFYCLISTTIPRLRLSLLVLCETKPICHAQYTIHRSIYTRTRISRSLRQISSRPSSSTSAFKPLFPIRKWLDLGNQNTIDELTRPTCLITLMSYWA